MWPTIQHIDRRLSGQLAFCPSLSTTSTPTTPVMRSNNSDRGHWIIPTASERRAPASLRRRQDVVIKPVNKGKAIVVWYKEFYIQESHLQLRDPNCYSTRRDDPNISINLIVKNQVNCFITNGSLPRKPMCLTTSSWINHVMYFLPKTHKPNNPGRTIVSPAPVPMSIFLGFWIACFNQLFLSCFHLLKTPTKPWVVRIYQTPPGQTLATFSLGCVFLYTSIRRCDGLNTLRSFLNRRVCPAVSTATLLSITWLVLTVNSFEFNGEYFNKTSVVL